MKKLARYITVFLAALLLGTGVPVDIFAEERELPSEAEEKSYTAGADDIDNDELYRGYVESLLYPEQYAAWSVRNHLTGVNLSIYKSLKTQIAQIASGKTSSTVLYVPLEDAGLTKTKWTAKELGIETLVLDGEVTDEAWAALDEKIGIDLAAIINTLLADCPYELYWFDKTEPTYGPGYSVYPSDTELELATGFDFSFPVAEAYAADTYEFDTAKITGVEAAVANAQEIVAAYSNCTDYEKVNGYRTAICELVSYDQDALDKTVSYGDPWQVIHVFDEDAGTNVVCEGYAKAFQYLCDSSTFEHESVNCISVTGIMSGGIGSGAHMWNVLTMDDEKNYLVDITNCDAGTIGEEDQLFLKGYKSGDVESGYTYSCIGGDVRFVYDSDSFSIYNSSELELTKESYTPVEIIPTTGTCGTNAVWTFDGDHTLTISGTGAIADYTNTVDEKIWNAYQDQITKLVIGDGITEIGAYAFGDLSSLKEAIIPFTVENIGTEALSSTVTLTVYDNSYGRRFADTNHFAWISQGLYSLEWSNEEVHHKMAYHLLTEFLKEHNNTYKRSIGNRVMTAEYMEDEVALTYIQQLQENKYYQIYFELDDTGVKNKTYRMEERVDESLDHSFYCTLTADPSEIGQENHFIWNYYPGISYGYNSAQEETDIGTANAQLGAALSDFSVNLFPDMGLNVRDFGFVNVNKESSIHARVEKGAVDAGCDTEGKYADVTCSVCGAFQKGTAIPVKGHSWDAGIVTQESTYTTEGIRVFTCANCYDEKTEKLPLKPRPSAPVLVKAASYSYNKIKLTWQTSQNAEGYMIYRKVPGASWSKIGEVTGETTTSYIDTNLVTNKTYVYTVRGYYTADGKKTATAYDTTGVSAKAVPNKSAITSTENKMPGDLTISWKKISGANGYRLYRIEDDGSYTMVAQIANGSTLSYTESGLTTGETYRYRVRAYRTVSGKPVFGAYSAIVTVDCSNTFVPEPILVKAASYSYNKIKITWNTVEGADGYRVYRKTEGSSWKSLKVIYGETVSSYIDTGAVTGTTYIYTVKAFHRDGEKPYWSSHDAKGVSAKAVPNKVTITKVNNAAAGKVTLTWKKVSGAGGYRIYYVTEDGKYHRIKQISSGSTLTYTHSGLKKGDTYKYRIRAYRIVNGKMIFGAYSAAKTATVK